MNQLAEALIARPTWQKIAGTLGIILLIGYLFYELSYKELLEQNASLTEKVESFRAEVSKETKRIRELPKLKKEIEELEAKLAVVLQELPNDTEIPDLLENIATLARDSQLDVKTFARNPSQQVRAFYAEQTVTMTVEGSFHQVVTFFDEVSHLARIVNVDQIALHDSQNTEAGMRVKADCRATTFRSLRPEEKAAGPEVESDKRRRRR